MHLNAVDLALGQVNGYCQHKFLRATSESLLSTKTISVFNCHFFVNFVTFGHYIEDLPTLASFAEV